MSAVADGSSRHEVASDDVASHGIASLTRAGPVTLRAAMMLPSRFTAARGRHGQRAQDLFGRAQELMSVGNATDVVACVEAEKHLLTFSFRDFVL
jgi:hypothetical protein